MEEVLEEGEAFGPEPEGEGEEEGEAGAVAEEVEFVEGAGPGLVHV